MTKDPSGWSWTTWWPSRARARLVRGRWAPDAGLPCSREASVAGLVATALAMTVTTDAV